MKQYRVESGPVSPPASLNNGQVQRLETGAILRSHETPWIRQALRDGRVAEDDGAGETSGAEETPKRKRGGKSA